MQEQHRLLDSLRLRVTLLRHLARLADLEVLLPQRVRSDQTQGRVVDYSALNLRHQRLEMDLLEAGPLEDSVVVVDLEVLRTQTRRVDLDHVTSLH